MKLPRFSTRTLFVLIALVSIPLGWSAYQLNWIRQRHEFLEARVRTRFGIDLLEYKPLPWSLRLFGEASQGNLYLVVKQTDMERGRDLFPETQFVPATE